MKKILGIIAGYGKFPVLLAAKARRNGYYVVAAGIQKDVSLLMRFCADSYATFPVGELKKVFEFLQQHQVKEVIMAGQVNPNHLFAKNLPIDKQWQQLFEAIRNRKADTIFTAVGDQLKREGMQLLDSTFLLKDHLAGKGTLTKRGPTVQELEDIAFGQEVAKLMGGIDVGQTVVVKDKAIVAVEAMEGTDQTILRGGRIAQGDAVVVKMSKPDQDLRFDVPVIGPRTIQSMRKHAAAVLAIEAHKTLIIDRKKTVAMANRAGICIVGT